MKRSLVLQRTMSATAENTKVSVIVESSAIDVMWKLPKRKFGVSGWDISL